MLKVTIQNGYNEVVFQNKLNSEKQKESVCGPIFNPIREKYSEFRGYIEDANLGLGCGFPFEFISYDDDDKIVDLGCAAGIDCFIMADRITNKGSVTGIDLTESLIIKANSIANKYRIKNIEFICGDIEKLSFENETIDTITSNGVFSLLPNLMHTFEEVFRILKNNGQFCFSDINKKGKFGPELYPQIKEFTGCLNGIRYQKLYIDYLLKAGFSSIEIVNERPVILPKELRSADQENILFITTFKIKK